MTKDSQQRILELLDEVVSVMTACKDFPTEGFDKLAKAMRIVEEAYYRTDEAEVFPDNF